MIIVIYIYTTWSRLILPSPVGGNSRYAEHWKAMGYSEQWLEKSGYKASPPASRRRGSNRNDSVTQYGTRSIWNMDNPRWLLDG